MAYYRVRGLPGFDNLIVEGNPTVMYDGGDVRTEVAEVKSILNANVLVGDRQLKFPMAPNCLFINADCLVEVDDPNLREWTTKSPFGKLEFEGHWANETVQVDYAKYENGMSVNVVDITLEPKKSLYTQNYFGVFAATAEDSIQEALRENNFIEDLIFVLKDIAAEQKIVDQVDSKQDLG